MSIYAGGQVSRVRDQLWCKSKIRMFWVMVSECFFNAYVTFTQILIWTVQLKTDLTKAAYITGKTKDKVWFLTRTACNWHVFFNTKDREDHFLPVRETATMQEDSPAVICDLPAAVTHFCLAWSHFSVSVNAFLNQPYTAALCCCCSALHARHAQATLKCMRNKISMYCIHS
jgi:hypothetical protein